MFVAIILITGTLMAIFGVLGYLKGHAWGFIGLLLLLATFVLLQGKPDFIVSTLNGLYLGVMLALRGGLSALSSGDLEAAKATLSSIERPFNDSNRVLALLLVVVVVVLLSLILGKWTKGAASVWGMIWGLMQGYIFAAIVLPMLIPSRWAILPVPYLRLAQDTVEKDHHHGHNKVDIWGQMLASLSKPENIRYLAIIIGLIIVLLVLYAVRKGVKSGAKAAANSAAKK